MAAAVAEAGIRAGSVCCKMGSQLANHEQMRRAEAGQGLGCRGPWDLF